MKRMALLAILILARGSMAQQPPAKAALKPDPIKWCHVTKDVVEVRSKPGGGEKSVVKLTRGALVPAYASKKAGKSEWLRVVVVDPALMEPRSGWVDPAEVEVAEAAEFPHDDKILALSGAPFVEDFAAENTAVARFILRTKDAGPVLVCYLGTVVLPQTRLQVFFKAPGRFKAGPSLDFPFSEMKSALTSLEVRDLVGDGNEFLITREPYQAGPQNLGVNMVIRRMEGNNFKTIWKAPISAKNFASYPPRLDILDPAEANIGRPGTDTKSEVEFRARGSLTDIVWKGEVNFHALGREKPLETIPLERTWSWDGAQFSLKQ
jgi:hypothetical protein